MVLLLPLAGDSTQLRHPCGVKQTVMVQAAQLHVFFPHHEALNLDLQHSYLKMVFRLNRGQYRQILYLPVHHFSECHFRLFFAQSVFVLVFLAPVQAPVWRWR